MNIFASVLGSIFEMYIGYMFFSKFGTIKGDINKNKLYFLILNIFHIVVSLILMKNGLVIVSYLLCLVLCSFLFQIKTLKRFIIVVCVLIISALAEMIVAVAATIGLNVSVDVLQDNKTTYTICIVLAKFLTFSILKPIKSKKHQSNSKYPIWFKIGVYTLPFTSLFIIILLYRYSFIVEIVLYQICTLCAAILLIISNLLIVYIFENQEKYFVTKERLDFAEIHIKEQRMHYSELYKQQEALKKYRHDSKNFYVSLISILESKSTEEAISYIKDKMSIISDNSKSINSGNPVVDSIIYSKKQICDNKAIVLKTSLKISETIKIDELEFGVLIGNALDNAIEATEELADSNKKIINLTILTSGEMISIEISNPTIKDIDTTNIETSKSDKTQHGYGLKGIETITNKYNGNLSLSYENNLFTLSAILVNL